MFSKTGHTLVISNPFWRYFDMVKELIYTYFISLFILLIVTYRNRRSGLRISLKVFTSLLFVGIAFLGFRPLAFSFNYAYFVFAGLVFSALGDLLLGFTHNASYKDNSMLRDGIIAFSLAHIAFIIGFNIIQPFTQYLLLFIPLGVATLFILLTHPKLIDTGNLRLPLVLYSFIIITMVLTALNTNMSLLIIGALCFVVSDIILGIAFLYGEKHRFLPLLNLLIYYIGQLCLALFLFK